MLLIGDYKNGWEHYEWRLRRKKTHQNPIHHLIIQSGMEKILKGEKLVITEQGLGDTIQFMRHVLILKQEGINASLCAQLQASFTYSSFRY